MKKPSIKQLLCGILFFTSLGVFAQPANDGCNTAQNLGSLPAPAACPSGVGSTINVSGSNINATAATPYTYLLGCSTGGNQPSPALDVWYSFVASGSRVTINITGGSPALASPAITLWTGNNCNNLAGVGCDNNGTAGGTNSATFEPLATGQTYYIQVSGMNSTATGNFNMALNASNDCADCNTISSLTVSPLPTYGTYAPGTQVTFCYTISNWVQVSMNWVHGIIPTFGNGWNLSTLQSSGTPPAANNGYAWFFANGPLGQGWWVDLNPTGPANFDGNFANNFGWPAASGAGTWTWCWTIQTNSSCGQGTNLNMSINTTSDGETGNWTSIACQDDPIYNFSAILNCCLPPTLTATNVLCNGASTGSITATPTSGASPWDFVWTNASGVIIGSTMNVTSNTLSNLPAGVYNVTVTDNAGCVSTAQRTITQPLPISAIATSAPICNGATNGAINITVGGPNPAFNVSWSGPSSGNPIGNEISISGGNYIIPSLAAGTYTITVTNANNCQITTSNTITSAPPLNVVNTTSPTLCASSTGAIVSTVSGGSAPYNVSWTGTQAGNPIGNEISVSGGSYTMTNLAAGNYTVTVTDAIGCVNTYTATINQPTATTFNATNTPANCYNTATGSITITPTAGVAGFNVSWSGVSSGNPAGTEISAVGGSYTIPSLAAGNYSLTVTASNNCTATTTITVTQPTLLTASSSATPILCNGGTSTVTVTATGGTGPYTGAGTFTVTAGTYTYTVTDANGCTATTTITVAQPSLLTASSSATPILCNGGTSAVTVTATGGTGPYTGAGTFTVTAGTYTYTVTDANGCTATTTITVAQPSLLTASSSATPILCNGGTSAVTVTATGGTGPYTGAGTFTVTAGTYTYTVTDANGCTATTTITVAQPTLLTASSSATPILCNGGSSTVTVTAGGGTGPYTGTGTFTVTAGTYTYMVTGANGCTATTTITVAQPTLLTASSSATPILCNGGSSTVTVTAAGGTGPYTGTGTFTVTAGTYTYTVTDASGCTSTVTITIAEPAPIVLPAITYN